MLNKRRLSTALWAAVFGTNLATLVLVLPSCKNRQPQADEELPETDEVVDSEDLAAEDDKIIRSTREYIEVDPSTSLPHPKRATAAITQFLVMTNQMPPRDRLEQCREETQALARSALNSEVLALTTKRVADVVNNSLSVYHWCFYYSMVIIDDKLQGDGFGTLLSEQTFNYSMSMKAVWILAIALDQATSGHRYFDYLRARYVQISRDFFARDIVPIAPPFGRPRTPINSPMDKPAGAANVDE